MPECDYCGDSFDAEDTYLSHLADEHGDELGRIDRRRVDQHRSSTSGIPIESGPLVLVGIILVAGAFVAYLTLVSNQGLQTGSTHIHGTITMTIDGERVPVAQLSGSPAFHFHGDNRQWHVEATEVSLKEGMEIVGVEIDAGRVTYDGTTYRKGEQNTTITFRANGQRIAPGTYILKDGDAIRITIETGTGS